MRSFYNLPEYPVYIFELKSDLNDLHKIYHIYLREITHDYKIFDSFIRYRDYIPPIEAKHKHEYLLAPTKFSF
jgi:hypothetical protein